MLKPIKKKYDNGEFPLISVIVPSYNHGQYIQSTIQSIIRQDYANLELLIVDDGSSDDSFQKINSLKEECKKKLKRFSCYKQKNRGLLSSLNKLISLANGEYIYFIASDDMASKDAISILYDFLNKNHDYGLAVGDNIIIDNKDNVCFWDKDRNIVYDKNLARYRSLVQFLQDERTDINFHDDDFGTYSNLLKGNHVPNGYLVRKSIIDKIVKFSSKAPLEDYYLMLQISKISKLKFIDKPLFYYRWHKNNSVTDTTKMLNYVLTTLKNEKKYALSNGFKKEYKERYYFCLKTKYIRIIKELISIRKYFKK